jgi:hypothetical protein
MKLRSILGVVAGGLVWMVMMPLLIILLTFVWPSLDSAVRLYMETSRFQVFDTSMLVAFQFLWPVTNGLAGLVTSLISKQQAAVSFLAAILVVYFAYNHLWVYWNDFPVWYNVLVVILVVPAVILGGMASRPSKVQLATGSSTAVS